jgi:hypothetical protein
MIVYIPNYIAEEIRTKKRRFSINIILEIKKEKQYA